MNNTISQHREWIQMRNNIHRSVNSLELCQSCERICECRRWLLNETVPVWLCQECQPEFSGRVEEMSGVSVSLST